MKARKGQLVDGGSLAPDSVKILVTTASEMLTFTCSDALDEFVAGQRSKPPNSLNQISQSLQVLEYS